MTLTEIAGLALLGLPMFLMLDAVLAASLGKRYRYWGLNHTPSWYRNFILKLYERQPWVLWMLILAEFSAGFGLFWLVRSLILLG